MVIGNLSVVVQVSPSKHLLIIAPVFSWKRKKQLVKKSQKNLSKLANIKDFFLQEIHKKGGRKFVFLNLGELGCLPGLRIIKPERYGDGCLEEASDLAKLHNKALNKLLLDMEQQFYGFKYFLYDFNSSLARKMTQSSKYGIYLVFRSKNSANLDP